MYRRELRAILRNSPTTNSPTNVRHANDKKEKHHAYQKVYKPTLHLLQCYLSLRKWHGYCSTFSCNSFFKVLVRVYHLSSNMNSGECEVGSVSKQIGFKQVLKLHLDLCSRRWIVISLIPLWLSWQKTPLGKNLTTLRILLHSLSQQLLSL